MTDERDTSMTDERQSELHGLGWDAYWAGKTTDDCPDFPLQEERDEWIVGWFSVQHADFDPSEDL